MSRGKHGRRRLRGSRITVVLLVTAGALLLLAGSSAFAAYRYDRAQAARIMPGVLVAGVDVGGMTRDEAIRAVTGRTGLTLGAALRVAAGRKEWTVSPADLGVMADVPGAVDRALEIGDSMSLFSRVYDRLTHRAAGASIDVEYRYDAAVERAFVEDVAKAVSVQAVDAGVTLKGDRVVFRHPKDGRALVVRAGLVQVHSALVEQASFVALPLKTVRPEVKASDLGHTIVVSKAENMLYVYEGFRLDRRYPVATAAPGYDTPTGVWHVVSKTENPTWRNPAPDGWGAGEPLVIPPGPGNPLGTRALYLNAPGIRIHGTYNSPSIGTYASHGCIRMFISDSEQLYPIIPIGTTVIIH